MSEIKMNTEPQFTPQEPPEMPESNDPFINNEDGTIDFNLNGDALVSGNIGIGTTNPTSKLQVAGNITPSIDNQFDLGSSSLRWKNFYVGSTIGKLVGAAATVFIFDNTNTTGNPLRFINFSSNVSGISSIYADSLLTFNPSTNSLGIGIANPVSTLDVDGPIISRSGSLIFSSANNSGNSVDPTSVSAINVDHIWNDDSNPPLSYGLTGTYHFVNDSPYRSTGNSALRAGGFYNMNDTGTASQRLQITGGAYISGNLGIGTINPGEKLQVDGNVLIREDLIFGNPEISSEKFTISYNSDYDEVDSNGTPFSTKDAIIFNDQINGPIVMKVGGTGDGAFIIANSDNLLEPGNRPSIARFYATFDGYVGASVKLYQGGIEKFQVNDVGISVFGSAYVLKDLKMGSTYNHSLGLGQTSGASNIGFTSTSALIWGSEGAGGITTGLTITYWYDNNAYIDNRNAGDIYIRTDTTKGILSKKLVFNKNGNLGIGITNPSFRLQVDGDIYLNSRLVTSGSGGSESSGAVIFSAASSTSNIDHIWNSDASIVDGVVGTQYGNLPGIYHFVNDSTYKSTGNSALRAGGFFNMDHTGTLNQRLQIDGGAYISDNLGVGITNPTSKLQVAGNIAPSIDNQFDLGSSSLRWKNLYAGSIIGNLVGAAATVFIFDETNSTENSLRFINFSSTKSGISSIYASNSLTFNPTNNNLGIGTTNPGEKLQVDGNIRVGISTTNNYIAFRGTSGDGVNAFGGDQIPTLRKWEHTYIGERIYDYSGNGERSELLLFKGNDRDNITGPDRVRVLAGEFRVDTYTDPLSGTFEQVGNSLSTNALIVTNAGNIGVGTTNPTSKLHVVGDLTTESVNGGALAGMRNRIINGGMDIAQRGTSFTAPAANTYTIDRWRWTQSGAMVCTVSQSTDVPNNTFQSSCKVDVTTVDSSIAAGDYAQIVQFIEGYNVRDLIGTTFTLSFWVKSSKTGVHCVSFKNSNSDRSYVKEYTIAAANTWEYKTLTVPGGLITSGTWDWTNGLGLRVLFSLANGSNFQTTADAWQTGNFHSSANQVNVMDNTANEFFITGVQLEPGAVATPFERRPYGQELALCQRYYEKSYDINTSPGTITGNGNFVVRCSSTNQVGTILFKQSKRAIPSIVYYNPSTGNPGTWRDGSSGIDIIMSVPIGSLGHSSLTFDATSSVNGNQLQGHWTASAEL